MKGSKWLIYLLLCFTGLLGGTNYFKNFSQSSRFPVEIAFFLAVCLTIGIEWGKNYCARWTIRTPLFMGFGHIFRTPANTFMYVALVGFAIATFAMSIINSTRGAHHLSMMLSQETDSTTVFKPNTASLDAQILGAQKTIEEANKTKWKGTTTVQSQRNISIQSKTIETLSRQRETLISQQRTDWEKHRQQKEGHDSYAADLILASGGWVELLQVLLILLNVSCEKTLDNRQNTPQASSEKNAIGFQRGIVYSEHAPPQQDQRNIIGFKRYEQPEVEISIPENFSQARPPQPLG